MVRFKDEIWILGGQNFSGFFDDIWRSSDGTNWTRVNPVGDMWTARSTHGVMIFDEKM